MLTKKDKEMIKYLVEKELKEFEKEESSIRPEEIKFLEGEEGYDALLKGLLKKLNKNG